MFVHFELRDNDDPRHVGTTHSLMEEPNIVNVPVSEEEYVQWILNPALANKKVLDQQPDGSYLLIDISEKKILREQELRPWKLKPGQLDPECDVVMVLTNGSVLVHVFNEKLATDRKAVTSYYATLDDDHSQPLFSLDVRGRDTLQEMKYDPNNIRVVLRNPIADMRYGLKIMNRETTL